MHATLLTIMSFFPRLSRILGSLLFAAAAFGPAISAENRDWIVPGSNLKERLLYAQAVSPNRENKQRVLDEVARSIEDGTLPPGDPSSLELLTFLAEEGVRTEIRSGINSGKSYPEVRRRACELLGRLGGARTEETLLAILESEEEPMVLAEAVFALGRLRALPSERLYMNLSRLLAVNVLQKHDDNLALACLTTIEKLDTPEHRMSDPELFRALLNLLEAPLLGEVRRKAFQVVDRLRN